MQNHIAGSGEHIPQPAISFGMLSHWRLRIAISVLTVLVAASVWSAESPNGAYATLGLGYSPSSATEEVNTLLNESSSGVAWSLAGGLGWRSQHTLEVRYLNVRLSAEKSQGVTVVAYSRSFGVSTPSPFVTVGVGLAHGPLAGVAGSAETDGGAALLLGGGLRFSRRLALGVDYYKGRTGKYFGPEKFYEMSHSGVVLTLRALVGGR